MILFIVLAAIAVLGGAAVIDPIKRMNAARAEERKRREDARKAAEQRAAELAAEAGRRMRDTPDIALLPDFLRFVAQIRRPRQLAYEEADREYGRRQQMVKRIKSRHFGGKRPKISYECIFLAAIPVFLAAFVVAIMLDHSIFAGTHVAMPWALAWVAVTGMTISSLVLLGGRRHQLLPEDLTGYWRYVFMLGAGALVVGFTLYMASLAPNRSIAADQPQITADERILAQDQAQVPPAPALVTTAHQQLIHDQASMQQAENVDRLSAAGLAVIEMLLAEGAVLGGEVVALRLAQSRSHQALRARDKAAGEIQLADDNFVQQLMTVLVTAGHDETVVRRIISRVQGMLGPGAGIGGGLSPGGPGSGPGGHAPGPAFPGPPGNAAPTGAGADAWAQGGTPGDPVAPGMIIHPPAAPGGRGGTGAAAARAPRQGPANGNQPRPGHAATRDPAPGKLSHCHNPADHASRLPEHEHASGQ